MNSKIIKKFTVTLFEVLDYNNSYFKYKMAFKPNIDDFMHGVSTVAFLDVYKMDSRLIFVAVEVMTGVAQEVCYKYLFERFGAIFDVNSNIPACIVRISGTKTQGYRLFVDDEVCEKSSI